MNGLQIGSSATRLLLLTRHATSSLFRTRALHAMVAAIGSLALLSGSFGTRVLTARIEDHSRLLQQRVAAELSTNILLWRSIDERLRALRPPPPGAAIISGQDRVTPIYWDFHRTGLVWGPTPEASIHWGSMAGPDLFTIVALLGSLAAGLVGLGTIHTGRRNGSTAAMLSFPVTARLIGTATAVALLLAMTYAVVVVLIATLAGGVVASAGTLPAAVADLATVLPAMAGPMVLYLTSIAWLGATIAILIRAEHTALLTFLSLWVGVLWLTPVVADTVAAIATEPVPRSAMEHTRADRYDAAIDTAGRGVGSWWASRSGVSDPGLLDEELARQAPELNAQWTAGIEAARRAATEVEGRWRELRERRHSLLASVRWVLPTRLLQECLAALAGTGDADRDAWLAAVAEHQVELNHALFDDPPHVLMNVNGHGVRFNRRPTPVLAALPVFEPPGTRTFTQLCSMAPSAVALLLQASLAGISLVVLIRREASAS